MKFSMKALCLQAALLALVVASGVIFALQSGQTSDITLRAPDGTSVAIHRDAYGVPHITAQTERALFFAQGFAAAQDRLYQMQLNWRGAAGTLSDFFGALFVDYDKQARLVSYTEAERTQLFNALPAELQAVFQAYSDGVNTYLDSVAANPAVYKPQEFESLKLERWSVNKTLAIAQFMARNFGGGGGLELDRLQELQTNGQAWFDQNRPINDPNAPTTIPEGAEAQPKRWHYSGMKVRQEIIRTIAEREKSFEEQASHLGLPVTLGSFAVLISGQRSSSGNVMLLGCPQMGAPKRNEASIPHEVELSCPTLHVGGITIAGLPLVIIGHTDHHAWSMTSGVSDNIDVYIDSTFDASYGKYYHNGQWLDFEAIDDPITSFGTQIPYTHYRTIHGPVFAADLDKHQVFSAKMTFWKQELDMAKYLYGIIKARSLAEFEAAAALVPMSFNLFYAGKDQNIKFWHLGKYQDRTDGVDPRLPHKGDGSEEWRGFIPFAQLPSLANPSQGYLVNWNNKPVRWWNNGDNVPWQGTTRLTQRVLDIDGYVRPISSFAYDSLKNVPKAIDDHGTYQQAIELSQSDIKDENVVPPGQSAFINLAGQRSPHFDDQWPLHVNWQFKEMEFGQNTVGVQSRSEVPFSFSISQNYPNPFWSGATSPAFSGGNPQTAISYQLPKPAAVHLAVYDINGRLVKVLVDEFKAAGVHQAQWSAVEVSSGTYFYRLQAGEFAAVKKCVVLK